MNYFENCKTLDEAKKLYWELAKKFHPDKGGDHKKFVELSNQFQSFKPDTEKFKGETDSWMAAEYAHIVSQLLVIEGIHIEICGSWIWLSGDTKSNKEKIKAIATGETFKRGFSKDKSMWYFSPKGYFKRSRKAHTMDDIRDYFGSEKPGKKDLKVIEG